MSSPWIKLEYTTPEKPEMLRAAKMLKKDFRLVFYHWVKLWIWADANVGDDGLAEGTTLSALSNIARMQGLAEACARPFAKSDGTVEEPWLLETPDGVRFKCWTRHNGESAKKRASRRRKRVDAKSGQKNDHSSISLSHSESSLLFKEFWEIYPLKVGKKPARARWDQAVRTTDPKVIIAAAERYAASAAGREYPKHAEGWLDEERWTDDPSAWEHKYGDKASAPDHEAVAARIREKYGE